jgi:methionine synthase II (cobalamin-independent)
MVEERNFAELASEFARDNFKKRHEAGLRVGRHGEAALEGARAVSSADLGAEHEGVAAVEGDGWLEVDGSRQVRHVISGEIPYLARQLSVF